MIVLFSYDDDLAATWPAAYDCLVHVIEFAGRNVRPISHVARKTSASPSLLMISSAVRIYLAIVAFFWPRMNRSLGYSWAFFGGQVTSATDGGNHCSRQHY
jgi:hypothetical protein